MANQNREIGIRSDPFQCVHIVGEVFELPIDPGAQGIQVHALHDGEILHDRVADLGWAWHNTEAAISHHTGGHAKRWRWGACGVPRDLRVVMGVQVDKPRHDRKAVGVDHVPSVWSVRARSSNFSVIDPDVSLHRLAAGTVYNFRVLTQKVEHLSPHFPRRAIASIPCPIKSDRSGK